ncbi:methionyl-tRNA formyltransferase [Protofrankia sp. BMG5.30]|uniref:methionyl-tRNA formyltransferase n=1 Tax=Protofrankia sp. BMG5.30 TaxID=1834514 RepID=UPI000976226B|nr:methionyl-tRNA formyltransferase [Protofrankia sp. BMG5.30]ONH34591.1 methionyl-tRNA formyltransferase [Protofrankia sp. BMG5.30]
MRVVFAGTPAVALPSLRALLDSSRHDVVAVVTRPDRPAGRGRKVAHSPVRTLAEERGVEVLTPQKPRDPDFLARLTEIAPDCCPVVAYGALLPRAALDIPRHGWVNLHFSLLPAWRGAAPVQRALLAGDDVTGASVFQIEEALDSGPVYGTLTEPVGPHDTAGDLLARLADAGSQLLVAVLDGIADGSLRARPQPAEGVSIAPKLDVADVRIDWSAPAYRVDRLVRAAAPAPGAWTTFRGHRIKIGPVRPVTVTETTAVAAAVAAGKGDGGTGAAGGDSAAPLGVEDLASGQIAVGGHGRIAVGTGGGVVLLDEVRPEGRPTMAADAWARGARIAAGERFT